MIDAIANFDFDQVMFRLGPAAIWLTIIWTAETYFSAPRTGRYKHGFVNLSITAINGVLLFLTIGAISVSVCSSSASGTGHAVVSFMMLDLFSYVWHRANHRLPWLWRFHAIHHSDHAMDVTTSGRFHTVELCLGGLLRLPVLYTLNVSATVLLTYETTLVAVSMLHHSTINLGTMDRLLRVIIVTPKIHSAHHSQEPIHYRCNFSSVFSIWDRIFRTFLLPSAPITHGLAGYDDSNESVSTLLSSPFQSQQRRSAQTTDKT